jgi:hypothetical protein
MYVYTNSLSYVRYLRTWNGTLKRYFLLQLSVSNLSTATTLIPNLVFGWLNLPIGPLSTCALGKESLKDQ